MNMLSLIISINTRIESCCFYVARKKKEEIKALDVVAWALQTTMIKSHQKHFPSIYTLAQHSSSLHRSVLSFSSARSYRDCAMRDFSVRDLCAKVTKRPESLTVCETPSLGWLFVGVRRVLWVERVERERERKEKSWEKIWFRGWSWTTYNNELNIYHSVYLHHKEINVSSTFERKISFNGGVSHTTTTGVLWGWFEVLLVFHVLVRFPSPLLRLLFTSSTPLANNEATLMERKKDLTV